MKLKWWNPEFKQRHQWDEILRTPISTTCEARVALRGEITLEALTTLIALLERQRQTYEINEYGPLIAPTGDPYADQT